MVTFNRIVILFAIVFAVVSCSPSKEIAPPEPLMPVPSISQLSWHEMEMNAFIHFTTNTFTDLEWGYGDEETSIFNPTSFDAEQWISTLKDAGFKGVILTCKHHDGFCLWPSAYTEHSIKNTPYKNGKGDIVKEVSDACQKYGLKFGVYLSPWDRNHKDYGKPEYIEYYRNQLKELFTNYGPIFEMWFDGANGGDGYYGGTREVRNIDRQTYYDWKNTLDMVRSIQPDVVFFSDAGPDIRWVGNESGFVNETNWNTITPDTLYAGKAGIEGLLNTGSIDGTQWIPAEVDVSIRPGWFYHEREDSLVKSPEKLFEIYMTSVGRGSNLLLNVPPDRRGLIHENDVQSLKRFKQILDSVFANDIAKNATVKADNFRGKTNQFSPSNINDGISVTYWETDDSLKTANIEFEFKKEEKISYILLQEYIELGQRVKAFTVEAWENEAWKPIAQGTTIGYKRILPTTPTTTSKIKISITDAKAAPTLSNVEVY